jgi:hypothetical protein
VYVDASKMTVGQWLKDWLGASKPRFRPSTYTRYKVIIDNDLLKSSLANLPVQKLRPSQIEQYYADAKVSASTLTLHHAILHRALRKAVKDRLLAVNPALSIWMANLVAPVATSLGCAATRLDRRRGSCLPGSGQESRTTACGLLRVGFG